jgi:carboxyvinyl-carboxyphosphonate phosphorylmutase
MAKTAAARREAFRKILDGEGCVRPASVFDPLSARIAEAIGFETMMLAGSSASFSVLGDPDLVLMGLSEFAGQARRVTRASDVPLLVDADHGYGNALNAMRTVSELEHAGVAALTIEDTLLPIPFGSGGMPALIPVKEGAAKIRAAVAAKTDPTLVVAARTGALRITSLEDTLDRIRSYEKAGADAIYLTGIKSREELDAASAATTLPLIIGSVPPDMDDLAYFASRRARLALQGNRTMAVAYAALHEALSKLRTGAHPSTLGGASLESQMEVWTREAVFDQRLRDYLG